MNMHFMELCFKMKKILKILTIIMMSSAKLI
jgi:hypothetical protein